MIVYVHTRQEGAPWTTNRAAWAGPIDQLGGAIPRVGDLVAPPGDGQATARVESVRWFFGSDPFVQVLATYPGGG